MYIDSNPVHESPESVLGAQFTVSFTVYIVSVSESSSGIEYSDILLFLYLLISNKTNAPSSSSHNQANFIRAYN